VREGLGVLWALHHFKYYVMGRNPIVICDCNCLRDILRKGSQNIPDHAMLRDWIAITLEYSPLVVHKPGTLMAIPDALSRHFAVYELEEKDKEPEEPSASIFRDLVETTNSKESLPVILDKQADILKRIEDIDHLPAEIPQIRVMCLAPDLKTGEEQQESTTKTGEGDVERDAVPIGQPPPHALPRLANYQRMDPFCSKIIDFLQGIHPSRRKDIRFLRRSAHHFWIDEHGILRKIDEMVQEDRLPPAVLPRDLWNETLDAYHRARSGGHRKYEKLLRAVADSFYFPGMPAYIQAYCNRCLDCTVNTKAKQLRSELHPYTASYPGILVHIDNTGGPCLTARGNEYIMAIVDSFTGYIRLYPTPQPCAQVTAEILLQYVAVNSMPLNIVSDNGPEFANEVYHELMDLLGLKPVFIAPYNSASNGKVETYHTVTKTILRNYMEEYGADWDLYLPLVEFAMNTSVSSATGYTPFYLHFGRHPILPLDCVYESAYKPIVTTNQYVRSLQAVREQVIRFVARQRQQVAEQSKKKFDAKHAASITQLKLGDQVVLRDEHSSASEFAQKYRSLWHKQIYVIVHDYHNGTYLIQDLKRAETPFKENIARLKPVKVRYEIAIHPDTGGISQTAVSEDLPTTPDSHPTTVTPAYDENDYDIEIVKIHDHRVDSEGVVYYKCQQRGYRKDSSLWYPSWGLSCPDLIREYHLSNPIEHVQTQTQTPSNTFSSLPSSSPSSSSSSTKSSKQIDKRTIDEQSRGRERTAESTSSGSGTVAREAKPLSQQPRPPSPIKFTLQPQSSKQSKQREQQVDAEEFEIGDVEQALSPAKQKKRKRSTLAPFEATVTKRGRMSSRPVRYVYLNPKE
jgi:transposase InsO family protein